MLDLHSHILAGIDDGASTIDISLAMARRYCEQGVTHVACTPHILPGRYPNTGFAIRGHVAALQRQLDDAGIALRLLTGSDNHVVPDFVEKLGTGKLLTIADSAYVLVEPPFRVVPIGLEALFYEIAAAGYIPILTHPERLSWIEERYDVIDRLADAGVWLQITSGSLIGNFGRRPRYWAERLLSEGRVHIMASDAHNMTSRPPDLREGHHLAIERIGAVDAQHLVVTRPAAVLTSIQPADFADHCTPRDF